ncbi:MAG: hypothetical protein ABS81_20365 [Pseudonocardia sp. SCN 72-86]|nr:MAG: hypothetical protein ABS81_20365 [Pseudonocardia sp. SCN 72-86]
MRVRLLVVSAELLAVVLVATGWLVGGGLQSDDLVLGGWLLVLGMVHIEAATGIERVRRRVAAAAYFDLSSVWTFAAALLLPVRLAALVVVVLYAHLWLRVWKPAGVPMYRLVYTAGTVVLAAHAAYAVVAPLRGTGAAHGLPALGWIALAAAAYLLVNNVLVAAAMALGEVRPSARELVGSVDDHVLELATLCLGVMVALALTADRWTAALALAPLLVLQRAVQVRQLEEAATTDPKTGLLNAAAWRAEAVHQLGRARRTHASAAVLIADLDHFKAVNDTHGHLVGDAVLAAVAAELRAEVRQDDLVARFGGEEFVVLLPDLPGTGVGRREVFAVADRVRRRVEGLGVPVTTSDGPLVVDGLTISIGGATFPADGQDLEAVLAAADAALYAAKDAGRNTVRVAAAPLVPQARTAED